MLNAGKPVTILLAEDDDDDYFLTAHALREACVLNKLYRVRDGEELMNFLTRRGPYQDPRSSPAPALILLDLNMPRKDGREALAEIKSDPGLRRCPVVMLTTSRAEEDVVGAYELGVNSFINKPVTFEGLVEAVKVLGRYWFQIVRLPTP